MRAALDGARTGARGRGRRPGRPSRSRAGRSRRSRSRRRRAGAGSGAARRPGGAGSPSGCGRPPACAGRASGTSSSRSPLERRAGDLLAADRVAPGPCVESRSQRSSFSRISRTARYDPPRAHSGASAPVKISSVRSTPMFCEPSAKPSRPRASATPGALRVDGLSSAKRWKQDCAQRPSSRPFVRRMMSRTAWWVIIAWSDWTSTQQVAVGAAGVEVVARERGHAAERGGPLRREPEAVVEQRGARGRS